MLRERRWTNHEIARLKVMYESEAPKQVIMTELHRTWSAVKTRAQLEGIHRPKRYGLSKIHMMQAQAIKLGLDQAHLPTNPSALKILMSLVQVDITTKPELDKHCDINPSTRNKALALLHDAGLVFIDDFSSPAEVVLKRKAYQSRPEPVLATPDQARIGELPTLVKLQSELDVWLPSACRSEVSANGLRALLVRQLANARAGDISHTEFYSIFRLPDQL
jgi:hypothetical protein